MPAREMASNRQNAVNRQLAQNRQNAVNRQMVAGVADDMTFLDEQIVAGATAANLTFSGISGAYRQLMVFSCLRCDQASPQDLIVRFNADSGANYDRQAIQGNNTGVTGAANVAQTSIALARVVGTGAPAGEFASGMFYIPYYALAVNDKMVVSSQISQDSNLAAGQFEALFAGTWRTSDALTSIVLAPGAGNFVQNSRAALYGIT